jgi:diguanylate cyclase (GGDEF)-like protein
MLPQKATILVVDDNPLNIRVLNGVLSEEHEVLFATNGPDALNIARNRKPDLILLDIMMPGMDGYEVCKRLKADPVTAPIPVVFITALNQSEDEVRGLECGAIDYITKPVIPPVVKVRVKNQLDLKRYRDLLESLSHMDGLTGIPNRRRFDDYLRLEWRRAARSGARFSLLMIDIDDFKAFNDNYGHLAGDDCLKQVAQTLAQCAQRPADMVARYGGEEFVCVMPETDNAGALFLARHMLESVRDLAIAHEHSRTARVVTISVGAATLAPMNEQSPEDLIRLADEKLYQAKQQGRNRIVF